MTTVILMATHRVTPDSCGLQLAREDGHAVGDDLTILFSLRLSLLPANFVPYLNQARLAQSGENSYFRHGQRVPNNQK
jgi:hypothetical protein